MVLSHLLGVFWWMRDFASLATATPVQPGPIPGFAWVVSDPWFQPGPFGVGLFFLISGLVIPFSLDRHSTAGFLLARSIRIWPPYLVALTIEMAILWVDARYWQRPFPYDRWTLLADATLLHEPFGRPSVDLVNWTLCIELTFYALIACVASAMRRGVALLPVAIALGLVCAAVVLRGLPRAALPAALSWTLRLQLPYLVFMCLGTVFTLRLRQRLGRVRMMGSLVAIGTMFVLCWWLGPQRDQFPLVLYDYGYALLLFAVCFLLRARFRPWRWLDALADISYPLYLIHVMVGMAVMKLLMLRLHVSAGLALVAALAVAGGLAFCIHRLVERPTIALGRSLV